MINHFLFFIAGATIGLLAWFYHRKASQTKLAALRDEEVRLQKEKQIIVDFMHNLAVAIGEGVARKELCQLSLIHI